MATGDGEEEPLYVNAKQYNRILKRRHARAKLEAEGKIPKQRQVKIYSHTISSWEYKNQPYNHTKSPFF